MVEPLVAEPLVATPDGNRNRSPATPSFQAPEETDGCFDVDVKWDETWKMSLFFD